MLYETIMQKVQNVFPIYSLNPYSNGKCSMRLIKQLKDDKEVMS